MQDALPEGEAKAVLRKALENGTPIKTIVAGVDKKTGDVLIIPVKIAIAP
ncbi:hypothetical protein [Marinomonas spartinae]|nr:hypothetical protein [Marinomonas spartinae]MBJ7553938.1 hypothetical protein [Marinomonas spartinae]